MEAVIGRGLKILPFERRVEIFNEVVRTAVNGVNESEGDLLRKYSSLIVEYHKIKINGEREDFEAEKLVPIYDQLEKLGNNPKVEAAAESIQIAEASIF